MFTCNFFQAYYLLLFSQNYHAFKNHIQLNRFVMFFILYFIFQVPQPPSTGENLWWLTLQIFALGYLVGWIHSRRKNFSWGHILQAAWFIKNDDVEHDCNAIVLIVGTNNVAKDSLTMRDMRECSKLLVAVRELFPNTPIYMSAVLPPLDEFGELVKYFNTQLSKVCVRNNVTFLIYVGLLWTHLPYMAQMDSTLIKKDT